MATTPETKATTTDATAGAGHEGATTSSGGGRPLVVALAWLSVGIPLAWGVAQTIRKALALFS